MKKRIAVIAGAALLVLYFSGTIFLRSIYVVPVLMYHSIDTKSDETNRLLVVSPGSFNRQMEFLKRHKYNVISLGELVNMFAAKKSVPARTVCLTFDDGYENNYRYAYPVLKRLGLPATIFVYTKGLNVPGCLTTVQLLEMTRDKIDIGSHTISHYWLGGSARTAERPGGPDIKRAREEIFKSKRILEDIISRKVNFFCYPAGAFTEEAKRLVIEAGYAGAVATNPGRGRPNNDPYAVKRLRISRQCDNLFVFWFETTGYYTWIKEHRRRR